MLQVFTTTGRRRMRSRAMLALRWLTLLSFVAGSVGIPLDPLGCCFGTSSRCATGTGAACQCSELSRSAGTCCCAKGLQQTAWSLWLPRSSNTPSAATVCASGLDTKPTPVAAERGSLPSCCANRLKQSDVCRVPQSERPAVATVSAESQPVDFAALCFPPATVNTAFSGITAKSETASECRTATTTSTTQFVLQSCPCGPESADDWLICGEPRILDRVVTLPNWNLDSDDVTPCDQRLCGEPQPPELPPPRAAADAVG